MSCRSPPHVLGLTDYSLYSRMELVDEREYQKVYMKPTYLQSRLLEMLIQRRFGPLLQVKFVKLGSHQTYDEELSSNF